MSVLHPLSQSLSLCAYNSVKTYIHQIKGTDEKSNKCSVNHGYDDDRRSCASYSYYGRLKDVEI